MYFIKRNSLSTRQLLLLRNLLTRLVHMLSKPGVPLGPQPLKQSPNCPSTLQEFLGRKFVRVARVHDVEICFEILITGPVLNGVTML